MSYNSSAINYDSTIDYDASLLDEVPSVTLPVAASDLVAWYPFRSGTGEDITAGDSNFGDTTDYSATVNGATFQSNGGTTDIQTGANSGAFDFDGTDDTLDLGTVADSDQSLTIMTWVNPDTLRQSADDRIITKADGSLDIAGSIILEVSSENPRFLVNSSGSFTIATASSTLSTNQFTHLAGRYNFQTGDISLFRNGQPVANTNAGQAPALSSQPWRIGEDNPIVGAGEFLDGTVDDTRIYQAALSDSQINQIYLNTKP